MGRGSITVDKAKRAATQGGVHADCNPQENSMTMPIQPTQGANATGSSPNAQSARPSGANFETALVGASVVAQDSFDTFPSTPPQAVLDEMAGAARVHDALHAQGRELRFARDETSGRVAVEVRDAGGSVLRTLSLAQALDVAAGKPLE
jgi:hypothetical protein